jgi:hypothetical protein
MKRELFLLFTPGVAVCACTQLNKISEVDINTVG